MPGPSLRNAVRFVAPELWTVGNEEPKAAFLPAVTNSGQIAVKRATQAHS